MGCILDVLRKGCNANMKRRFPVYFLECDEFSTTPNSIVFSNDRVKIPPSLRKYVLEQIHSKNLGVGKMNFLTNRICKTQEITAYKCHTAKNDVEK